MYLIGIVVCIIILALIVGCVVNGRNGEGDGAVVCFCFAAVLITIGVVQWNSAAGDLINYQMNDQYVEVAQDRLDHLKVDYTTLTQAGVNTGRLLVNGDSPLAAMITAITECEGQLAEAKLKKVKALMSMKQREIGPFALFAKIVGIPE